MGDHEGNDRGSKRRSGERKTSQPERPRSFVKATSAPKRQSQHQQHSHVNRRNRQIAAGRSQFGGMASADMAIVQLANLKKQYVMESKQMNAQKKRMKDIEKNVAELKKQERGLGVKKANARIAKLEDHVEKINGLVADETREREIAQQEVGALTEEVAKYSKLYEEVCRRVEELMKERVALEEEVLEKKQSFDYLIKEQEDRLNAVEEELYGLDEDLKRDNMVRNRVNDDKKTIESLLDKLRDLQKSEENNITADKDFLLDMIDEIEVSDPSGKRSSITIGGSSSLTDSGRFSSHHGSTSSTYLPAFYSTQPSRSTTTQMSAPRFSIMQARESYKAKRESAMIDGPPSFF